MHKPVVSIILCTHNRADSLRETLKSLGRLAIPADMPAELLVVDNASTDHTRRVVEEAHLQNMPVRYMHEPRPGKSRAANLGMCNAEGDIFLWTDDDVRPSEGWLDAMCRPIFTGDADAVAGGLPNAPHLHGPWPRPTRRRRKRTAVAADRATLVGGNMAFARRVREKVPAFDPGIGPGALGFAEDTLFSHQLHEAGYVVRDAPEIEAEHHFSADRLTRAGLLAAARKHGRSNAWLRYHWSHRERRWPRLALGVYRLWHALFLMTHIRELQRRHGCHRMEYRIVEGAAAFRQYLIEQKKDRLYDRHGLRRRSSIGDA